MGIAHVLESIQPAAFLYPLPAACDTAVYATKHTLPREHAVHGYPRVVALDGREEMEVEMHFKLMRYLAWRKPLVGNYYPTGYVVVLYYISVTRIITNENIKQSIYRLKRDRYMPIHEHLGGDWQTTKSKKM